MKIHARAAVKRSDMPPTARVYVHAVLLNDPVRRLHRYALRGLEHRREPLFLDYWQATEAICSRPVRVIYAMSFHNQDDDACPECKQLMSILQFAPEQYPEQARRIAQQVQEHERRKEERRNAQREAKRFIEAADESDEEEPPPDLMELLERANRDDPDTSHTA